MVREASVSPDDVVVRIAPSPTGSPHVGTAYIALFNLALRRKQGGRFILRIEDTDRSRSTKESEEQIYDAMEWLGIGFDESPRIGGPAGPYRQSERSETYRKFADDLVARGKAYLCFCTEKRIEELRVLQKKQELPIGYDGLCKSLSRAEIEANLEAGRPYVIRLLVDHESETVCHDFFRKRIAISNMQVDDQVLIKSDGFPTYHLANVVDDHLMGVTHVIRAEEWISSLPKHVILYGAFGWEPPVFAHMPLLRNKDKSKISKRKNPTSLVWFRDAGYLPEAMVNFLSLMGYSPPPRESCPEGNPEIFGFDEMVRDFDLSRVKTSGPIFDLEKLDNFNGVYIRKMTDEECVGRLLGFYAYLEAERGRLTAEIESELPAAAEMRTLDERRRALTRSTLEFIRKHRPSRERLVQMMGVLKERMKNFLEFADVAGFFFEDALSYDPGLLVPKKTNPADAAKVLRLAADRIESVGEFSLAKVEDGVRSLPDETGWKGRALFMAIRVAVTGSDVSPPLFESMEILGREKTVLRLRGAAGFLDGIAARSI